MAFALTQAALSVGLETRWTTIRDPDFALLEHTVRRRQAAAPGRQLVFVVGSSRTQGALRAERLNDSGDPATPLVLNCSLPAGGPMLYQVVLRRLQDAGFQPRVVFLETMPLAFSARDGSPVEERWRLAPPRYTAAEVARLYPYYAQPYRLWFPWAYARVLPCYRHQGEFRDALGLDLVPGQSRLDSCPDFYGWVPCTRDFSPQEVEVRTREALEQYATALTQAAVAPGARRALCDVVGLCRDNDIRVVLFAPPESSRFRSYAPAVAEGQMRFLRGLAARLGVSLIDARTWIDDDGFWDGHHVTRKGADPYTERFRREALGPYLPSPHPGPVVKARAAGASLNP